MLIGAAAALALTAGCSGGGSPDNAAATAAWQLPEYAHTSPRAQAGYEYALRAPALLEQMPCYCGCVSLGHRHLRDCFLRDDGTFNDHAAACAVCLQETVDVQTAAQAGASPATIRAQIDAKYGDLGVPTDTPAMD